MRLSLAKQGPLASAFRAALALVDDDIAAKLVPELLGLLRRGGGLATRVTAATAVDSLCQSVGATIQRLILFSQAIKFGFMFPFMSFYLFITRFQMCCELDYTRCVEMFLPESCSFCLEILLSRNAALLFANHSRSIPAQYDNILFEVFFLPFSIDLDGITHFLMRLTRDSMNASYDRRVCVGYSFAL